MKYVIIFALCLFITMLVGCNTPTKHSFSEDGVTIFCGFRADKFDIKSLLDGGIEFIPLETNSESLIGKISSIRFYKGNFYVVDSQQERVIIFNENGKHISTISHKGRGPCEYIQLFDMRINKGHIVEILGSQNPTKLIRYDEYSQECVEISLPNTSANQFIPTENGYIFHQAGGVSDKEYQYFIFITDKEGNIEKKLLPSHPPLGHSIAAPNNFYMINDTVVFFMHLDENIYQITQEGEMTIRYSVNFGNSHLPDNVKETYKIDFFQFREQAENYAAGPFGVCETRTHLYFRYIAPNQNNNTFHVYFNKTNRVVHTFQTYCTISLAILDPLSVTDDDRFISFIDTANLEYIDREKKENQDLISIYDSLPEFANPILVLYKLR